MRDISEDELFAMVNLVPRLTGLPMTIWVRPESGLPHDIRFWFNARPPLRIKVNMTHGRSMSVSNLATVGVRPAPWLVAGQLSPADMRAVSDWIRLNEDALVDYWHFRIDTDEFCSACGHCRRRSHLKAQISGAFGLYSRGYRTTNSDSRARAAARAPASMSEDLRFANALKSPLASVRAERGKPFFI